MDREISHTACLHEAAMKALLLQASRKNWWARRRHRHLAACVICRKRLERVLDGAMARACLGLDALDWEAFVCYRLHNRPADCVARELGLTVARVVVASTKALLAIRLQLESSWT